MRAGEFVSEIGDSPAEHEPNRRRRRSLFHATVDGQWVDVFFDRSDLNGTLHITFTVNNNYEAPKVPTRASGSTIKILSTVLAIIRQRLPEYIRSARPPAVSFTAQGDRRAALYRKYFVPVIQDILGPRWELNEYPSMGMTVFNWRPAKQDRTGINEIGAPGELDVSEKLQKYFTDRGYTIAGEGRDQMVFHRPGQRHVIKVIGLGDDLARRDNVADYVRFFALNQRNPHFPRVSQPREIRIGDEIYTIYRQELLQNLPGEEEVMDWMEKFGSALSDPARARAWARENPPPASLPRPQVQGLYTAVRRLQQFYGDDLGGSIKMDLGHVGNFMQRADGTIVVVDPLAYDESYDTYSESVTDIADGSDILYHATYRPLLKSIMGQGLGGSAAQAKWEDSEPGVTYLARDPEVARSYAETSDMVPEEWLDDIVILAIDASRLDPRKLRQDRNVQDDDSTLEYHGVIKDFTLTENFADSRPVVDMLEEGCLELSRMLEERPHLIENYEGWGEIQSLLGRIVGQEPVIGQHYSVLNLTITPPGRFLVQQGMKTPVKLTNILDRGSYVQYEFDVSGRIFRFPEDHRAGDRLSRTFLYSTPRELEKIQSFIAMSLQDWEIRDRTNENFADGKVKGKSRPGRVKRAGASCKGSVTDLRARAKKYGGERGKMYQWCLNMKRGRKK